MMVSSDSWYPFNLIWKKIFHVAASQTNISFSCATVISTNIDKSHVLICCLLYTLKILLSGRISVAPWLFALESLSASLGNASGKYSSSSAPRLALVCPAGRFLPAWVARRGLAGGWASAPSSRGVYDLPGVSRMQE